MTTRFADKPEEKGVSMRHITAASTAMMRLLDDSVLVLKRSGDEKRFPGYFELPGGKVEGVAPNANERNTVEIQLAREVHEEVDIVLDPKQIWYGENDVIAERDRVITALRYLSIFPSGQKVDIKGERAHDKFEFVKVKARDREALPYTRSKDYHTLNYIGGVREFLDRLFTRQQQKGTLLANVDAIHEYYVNYIFVDPKQRKVLLAKDSGNADYNFSLPTTAVLRWEHLHDAIHRGVPEVFSGRNLSTEFFGRRVLAKLTPVKRGEIIQTEQRCDFIYLIYIPDLYEKTQSTPTGDYDYEWVGFKDKALTKECAQLQAHGLKSAELVRIFKEILHLSHKKNIMQYRERMFPIFMTTDEQKANLYGDKTSRSGK